MSRVQFLCVATLIFAAAAMPREGAAICAAVTLVLAFVLQRRGG